MLDNSSSNSESVGYTPPATDEGVFVGFCIGGIIFSIVMILAMITYRNKKVCISIFLLMSIIAISMIPLMIYIFCNKL